MGINADLYPNPGVDVVISETGLPFRAESFDVVVSNQVMEHNHFIEDYYREAARVLKPWGFMFLHFPHKYQFYDGHSGRILLKQKGKGYNWQSKGYHKKNALKYFAEWIDLQPYYRQVKALVFKNKLFSTWVTPI